MGPGISVAITMYTRPEGLACEAEVCLFGLTQASSFVVQSKALLPAPCSATNARPIVHNAHELKALEFMFSLIISLNTIYLKN